MAEARSRGILLTWFPVEERWAACSLLENFKYEPLSQFHSSRQGALDEAIATLAARPKP